MGGTDWASLWEQVPLLGDIRYGLCTLPVALTTLFVLL
jgi:hypothetical protein